MDTFKFTHSDIEISTVRIDMDALRSLLDEWDKQNPEPEPPEKSMEPSKFRLKEARAAHAMARERGISLDEAEAIVARQSPPYKDDKDPDYLAALENWRRQRYLRSEEIVWAHGVLFQFEDGGAGSLVEANGRQLADSSVVEKMTRLAASDGRYSLYKFIISNSELTWEAVMDAAKGLGIKRNGKPILETIPSGEGEPQAIAGLGAIAAKNNGISPADYKRLPVSDQALVLAVYLCERWNAHYASVDHAEKEKRNGKSRNRNHR